MRSFSHAVAAITGAGSGIGRALAVELAGEGARLALSDIDDEGLAATARLADRAGADHIRTDHLDVADRAAFLRWADDVADDHGVVNLVFNNAGVAMDAPALDQDLDDIDWLLDINLGGVITGTQAFLPHLVASGDGHLVNISSVFGLVGVPGQSAYNAAKFGVRGYTEAIRQEMDGEGLPVQVHCVHPGGIATNIVRSARTTDPERHPELTRHFDELLARTTPQRAARIILRGVRRGRSRILVGPDAWAIYLLSQATGTLLQKVVPRLRRRLVDDPTTRPVHRTSDAA